ncbi:MAG TPA: MFS transporter [Dehalococcoidia bacterium]|nr:MFS transporter [Dehalococcoidia bacterium]
MRAASGLWANTDFLKLWAGETVSVFGSLVGRTALPFAAILVLDARPFQIALLAAADIVPGLLVGLVAGVWVDRLRRRPILIAADIGRAALLCSIPLAYALDMLHIEQLYAVAFLAGVLTMFFDVAYLSYLPSVVRREELLEGNSKLAASSSMAEVGAFGVAGWLVQLLTAPVAILIDALSFLFSALFVSWIRSPEPAPAASERQSIRREIAEGVRLVVGDPLLRATAGSVVTADFSFRVFGTVFLLFAVRDLGFHPGILGMIFAVGGVSSLLGSLVAGRSARRLGTGTTMVGGVLLMGLSMLFVPLAQGATVLAAALLLAQQLMGDGAFTVYEINQVSLRQAITADRLLGRVNASIRFAGLAAMLVGALVGGLLGETIGLRATLVVGAGGLCLGALWLALSPVRGLRSAPVGYVGTPAA